MTDRFSLGAALVMPVPCPTRPEQSPVRYRTVIIMAARHLEGATTK